MEFVCHCSVSMYDLGLEADTKANPNITVEAKTKAEAVNKAKGKLTEKYSHPKTKVKSVVVDLVNKI